MGDYADDAFERELDGACYDYDHGDTEAFTIGYPTYYVNKSERKSKYSCEKDYHYPIENNFNYFKVKFLFKINDEFLLRKLHSNKNKRINKVVKVIQITEKAILFEYIEEWTNVYNWEMKGLRLWIPKSILYQQKNELKVLYIPSWANTPIINPPGERIKK